VLPVLVSNKRFVTTLLCIYLVFYSLHFTVYTPSYAMAVKGAGGGGAPY